MRFAHCHTARLSTSAGWSSAVLACSAVLALLLGMRASSAAGDLGAQPRPPRATLTLSISRARKLAVIGVARCVNSPLRHGARGTIVFGDGATQIVHLGSTRVSHAYRFAPPYTVRLICRGTNGRVASRSVVVDVLVPPQSP